MSSARERMKAALVALASIAAAIATASGCVAAVDWSVKTLGGPVTGMVGTFILGWVLAWATARLRFRSSDGDTAPSP